MEAWWNTQNPDEVYFIATYDWTEIGVTMPYATEVYGYYDDFGNGYVPFFGVIGAYNIFMYGDNDHQSAIDMVPDAIDSFNYMGVIAPIEDRVINFWGFEYINVSGVFAHPEGLPIDVSIQDNSNPDVVNAELIGDELLITVNPLSGSSDITLLGEAGDDFVEYTFNVMAVNPNTVTVDYELEDSPEQDLYPNNPSPYSNSYTDLGWTDFEVTEDQQLSSVHLSCNWTSIDYPTEGSFRMTSPAGTDVLLYESASTDPVNLEIDVNDLVGENGMGTWIVYMLDSFGDGGHIVNDGIVSLGYSTTEIGTAFGTVSDGREPIEGAVISAGNISTLTDENGNFMFDIISGVYEFTCEVEGMETLTVEEEIITDETTIIIFDYLSGGESVPEFFTSLSGNYPNPFNPETTIEYSIEEAGRVVLEIFNTKGQLVKTLVDDSKTAGNYSTVWKGMDEANKQVSSGIYFYRMKAGDRYTSTKKMILLK